MFLSDELVQRFRTYFRGERLHEGSIRLPAGRQAFRSFPHLPPHPKIIWIINTISTLRTENGRYSQIFLGVGACTEKHAYYNVPMSTKAIVIGVIVLIIIAIGAYF